MAFCGRYCLGDLGLASRQSRAYFASDSQLIEVRQPHHYLDKPGTGQESQITTSTVAPAALPFQSTRSGPLHPTQRLAGQSICCSGTPNFNPQNVPDPEVMPGISLGPEETVRVQLDALQNNDEPWPNHGLQTAYEFGEDIGGLERSRYFGYSKDLYHFDHFLGQFQNAFPELVGLTGYAIDSIQETGPDTFSVAVTVTRHSAEARLRFLLVRKDVGRKKGALMTKSLLREN